MKLHDETVGGSKHKCSRIMPSNLYHHPDVSLAVRISLPHGSHGRLKAQALTGYHGNQQSCEL